MSTPVIDDTTHGAVHWWPGQGPKPVSSYTGGCLHRMQRVIAYGWDLKHYELVECDQECGSRAWSNEKGKITTAWMQPTSAREP